MSGSGRTSAIDLVFLLLAAAGIAAAGCSSTLEYPLAPAGTTVLRKTHLRFNGLRRTYRIHIPIGYRPQRPVPLVIVVHGAFSTAKQIEKQTGFSTFADRHHFAVAYPNGIGIFGFLQHWNAGHCCGKAAADGVDDIGFIDETIADTRRFVNIDPSRIYMIGFSNGGMFTHRYGAERSAQLAAIAPLAGPAGGRAAPDQPEWRVPPSGAALPVFMMHGTGDDKVPYEGGARAADTDGRQYISARESAELWVRQNRCNPLPVKQEIRDGGIEISSWTDCRGGAAVQLYALQGWGHQWPGPYFTDRLEPQDPLYGFDAARAIWQFFKQYKR